MHHGRQRPDHDSSIRQAGLIYLTAGAPERGELAVRRELDLKAYCCLFSNNIFAIRLCSSCPYIYPGMGFIR